MLKADFLIEQFWTERKYALKTFFIYEIIIVLGRFIVGLECTECVLDPASFNP